MSVELPSRSQKSHYNSKIRTPKGRKRCSGLVNVNTTQNSEKDERSDLREESCIQKFRLKEEHFTKDDEQIDNDTTKIRRDIILSVSTEQNPDKSGTKDSNSIGEGGKLGKLKNVVIRKRGRKYLIETHRFFDSLHELMEFYKKNSGTLNRFTFMLKNPIKRQSWEYLHTDVKQGELLGKGAFGEVHAGKLQLKSGEIVEVAIKVHKGCSDLSKAKIKEMMKEARLMRNFNHRNIVRIYGVAVDEQPIYILLELVTGGALNSFLKSNAGQVEVRDKIMMCHGAAQGVEYLHDQRCMHRDLAARNCLITNDKVVKISDFGLSRMGTVYTIRASMRLPIKWLAPETITAYTFSLKTDVFSFGVVVFEIFSDGAEPWEGRTNAEVKIAVVNGEFVKLPMCCPEPLRSFFANKVFTKDPACRANMTDVVAAFERAACPHAPSEASRLRRKVLGFVSIPRLSSL